MLISTAETWLSTILDCGYCDISILDDVGYDIEEIINNLKCSNDLSLNSITREIFRKGIYELKEALKNKILEVRKEMECYEINSKEHEELVYELEQLSLCDPDEDICWYCNCMDTSIYFVNNGEIYREYLENEISSIENNMGFKIRG